jgi:hypothetical protein
MVKAGYKKGEIDMEINEYRLDATVVLNNIKAHNYSIQDYSLSEYESKIVMKALERYLADLKFEQELKVY